MDKNSFGYDRDSNIPFRINPQGEYEKKGLNERAAEGIDKTDAYLSG